MGGCYEVPKRVSYDTHYDCGLAGYSMAYSIAEAMGREYVNKNNIIISFQCSITKVYETKPELQSKGNDAITNSFKVRFGQ